MAAGCRPLMTLRRNIGVDAPTHLFLPEACDAAKPIPFGSVAFPEDGKIIDGISKAWGDFVLELSGGATFFTDNDEFYPSNRKLEQDPGILKVTAPARGNPWIRS